MKSRKTVVLVLIVTGLLLIGNVNAGNGTAREQQARDEIGRDGPTQDRSPRHLVRASRLVLIGAEIRTLTGEDLGMVEDLLVDVASGAVRYVVISAAGFVTHNELMAVPVEAFRIDRSGGVLVLDVSRDVLEHAPSFQRDDWPRTADNEWTAAVDDYYRSEGGQKEAKVLN